MAEGHERRHMNSAGLGFYPKAANRVTLAKQFRNTGNRRGSAGSGRQNVSQGIPRKGELCPSFTASPSVSSRYLATTTEAANVFAAVRRTELTGATSGR
jgi:hypothetical protein